MSSRGKLLFVDPSTDLAYSTDEDDYQMPQLNNIVTTMKTTNELSKELSKCLCKSKKEEIETMKKCICHNAETISQHSMNSVKSEPLSDLFDKISNISRLETKYQRVTISELSTDVTQLENLDTCSRLLKTAIKLRKKYSEMAEHKLSNTLLNILDLKVDSTFTKQCQQLHTLDKDDKESLLNIIEETDVVNPWNIEFPNNLPYSLYLHNGIFQIQNNDNNNNEQIQITSINNRNNYLKDSYPEWSVFINDVEFMINLLSNGPLKTFCYRRLMFLQSKFQLHVLLNEVEELKEQKQVAHRDFYNLPKVDTYVNAASCMNHKHLLRFIKNALKKTPDQVVCLNDNKPLTLAGVFEAMKLTAYDLTVDNLDVHADRNTFHRYDQLNDKFNPSGESLLRKVFLKTDNYINGNYFAQIIKEVIIDLEESKYQNVELRINLVGRSQDDWFKLAKWAVDNNMYSENVRWLVQFYGNFQQLKSNNLINTFEDYIINIFHPLFEITISPKKYPELHQFLNYVVGFDLIYYESSITYNRLYEDIAKPKDWINMETPPYAYYMYYIYSNLCCLNQLRLKQNLNTFEFRPRCGESGSILELIYGFLLAGNISHGLMLRKTPTLQYLYYLCQIGIALSPLSNNCLILNYHRNPLMEFFSRGLLVSLSTDHPLHFHFTREPLMEEYSIAAQVWKLNSCDMCELARNSVLMSGYSHDIKCNWLGPNYQLEGVAGNDFYRTNVPNIRISYRTETLVEELITILHSGNILNNDH